MGVFCIGHCSSTARNHALPPNGIEYMNMSCVRLGQEAMRYRIAFLFISSFDCLTVVRSLASKFCWSITSQFTLVPTHTSAQKRKIGMSKGRRKLG